MRLKEYAGDIRQAVHTAIFATIVFIIWAGVVGCLAFIIVVVLVISWKAISLVLSSAAYTTIFSSAEATATLVGVVIAGLFGFGGIILTNSLSARAARRQAEEMETRSRDDRRENERLARELQIQIAKGMDRRVQEFGDAFAKYHAETIAAIRRDQSSPDSQH
nr:hypothetical protein [uncultured Albidiferax sp.]